jgi:hypothetical protein
VTIFVFTGPTISADEAGQWLDATYLPPVSQGDVISLLRFKPRAIGIIDGYFDSVPAVWHKEILYALAQGVHVAGASSMGALRAAELHPFGMVGIGEIFEWYRDGLIEADDEVALQHAPAAYGYRALSEPLVNIRKTVQAAQEAGVISCATQEALLAIARRTLYWERAYPRLLADGQADGLPAKELEQLRSFIAEHAIDLKRRDAIAMLRYLADLPKELPPFEADFELQETVFFTNLLARDRTIVRRNGMRLTIDDLVDALRLEPDFLALKQRALVNDMILDLARVRNLKVGAEERKEAAGRLGMATDDELAAWAQRNDLDEAELEQLLDELAIIHKLRAIYDERVSNRSLLRQLRIEGQYEKILQMALEQKAGQEAAQNGRPAEPNDLYAAYFAELGQEVSGDLQDRVQAHAAALGYERLAQFLLALERRYR